MLGAADAPQTREEESKVNRINDFWKPFYFRWVETFLDKGSGEELVPLKHFLHRFTRSIFWEIEDMIPLFVPPTAPPPSPPRTLFPPPPSRFAAMRCERLPRREHVCAWGLKARWVAAQTIQSIAASGGGWGRLR